ncbi:MAG: radical SAM protein [bacterium]|nr:radical SAM protein [bacterium]
MDADKYADREARIKLTPKCNYKCFFCHEEGGCQSAVAEWTGVRSLLLALKSQGRREITFTGGEPLLNKPVLLKALAEIASWDVQPEVTLITNAALLDETVVRALEACANAKVNVSVHDPRPAEYRLRTGQTVRTPDQIKPMLKRLALGLVRVKVNAVLTSEFVENGDAMEALFTYARDVGAGTVKFVELLRTKDAASWPKIPASVDEMERCLLRRGLVDQGRTLRTSYWRTLDGLCVEVTRCACAVGCAHCLKTRGDFFTGGTHFHPCFMSRKTIPLEGRSLDDVLAEGDAYLMRRIAPLQAA